MARMSNMKHTIGYIVLIALMLAYRFHWQEPILVNACNTGNVSSCDMLVVLGYKTPLDFDSVGLKGDAK